MCIKHTNLLVNGVISAYITPSQLFLEPKFIRESESEDGKFARYVIASGGGGGVKPDPRATFWPPFPNRFFMFHLTPM